MNNEKDITEMIEEYYSDNKCELEDVLDKINNGETTTENYFKAFELYQQADDAKIFKSEIDKYAQLTIQSAMNDIDMDNNSPEAYIRMSAIFQYKKNNEKMLECINKAIELNPDEGDYYILRAQYYLRLGKKKYAELDYQKACEIDPELTETVNTMKRVDKLINEGKKHVVMVYVLIVVAVVAAIISIFV